MNLEYRYSGRTDQPLAEEGRRQIEELWSESPEADLVVVSPMKRCIETAQVLFPGKGPEDFIKIPEWIEMDFGQFEGKNYEELNGNPVYQKWIDSGGTERFPEGEDKAGFTERVSAGFEGFMRMTGPLAVNNTLRVTAVVHGGTIMALLSALTGLEYYDFQCKNGNGYRIELSPDGKLIKEPEKLFA